jgi:hypothetical protein
MRILMVLVAFLALAISGFVGFVIHKESQRSEGASGRGASAAAVVTISEGEAVDVDANVPAFGYTVVMFTADW